MAALFWQRTGRVRAWGLVLLAAMLAAWSAPARAQDRVILQLQWDNQFQFAGYYAALWQGYYRDAGLDVEIRSAFPDGGGPLRSPVREVSEGRAQFGTSNAGVLLALSGGARIVVVASIFQQSGTRLYYRRDLNVRSLADLVTLRLGRNQGNELLDMELRAMLAAEGIDPARLNVVLKAPNRLLQAMAEGEYDMTFGYILSAPFEMRELGLDFAEMRPSDYGIAFYGDSLITSPELAARNPELVQRFKDATLRGWRYALDNSDAMAERIARDLPRYLPIQDRLGFNRFMIPIVRELTLYPIVDLGNINPERWRLMAQQLVRARVLPEVPDLSNFVFDPDRDRNRRADAARRFLAISATVTLAAALLALAWVVALRRAVAGARKRLEQSQEALLQARKLEAVGQMTGGVAHDFNNLLQVVASGLTLLERPNTDESRRRAVLTAMRRAVERGTRIAAGMLAFARRKSFVPERIAPSARLPAMRDLIEGALRGDIVLRMDVPPNLWPVDADATQLEIALLNLAVNARDAMPKGGTLTLTARNGSLPAGGDLSGEAVEVAVADTGTGMPPEALARAFEPFFTTKPVGKGTGLGLAQVYGFARGSGGTVRIDSTPGEGTTVRILLPRAAGEAPVTGDAAAGLSADPARPLNILLVEDDDGVATVLTEVLTGRGHQVQRLAAAGGALAVLAEGARPDVVLTDLVMPGGRSGLDLALEIRARHPGQPVLLMTGFAEREEEALAAGLPLLRKPVEEAELLAALAAVAPARAEVA